jgi:hypothetical protein
MKETAISIFEGKEVRRSWYENQWYFSVADVVRVLTDSADVKQYIKKMRTRDLELSVNWGTFCTPLDVISKDGKVRQETMSHLQGIFRIIQSIPSKKAEPFKVWLARVGQERIAEIQNPELAAQRARSLYRAKGYPEAWIEKRMRGIEVRETLTNEWQKRGAKKGVEYAILTNDILTGTFGMKAEEYKKFKGLKREDLRDHMDDMEIILTMLGEATTTRFSRDRDSMGFPDLRKDAKDGGSVAGRTRKDIELRSGKKVATRKNYLGVEKKTMKKLKEIL